MLWPLTLCYAMQSNHPLGDLFIWLKETTFVTFRIVLRRVYIHSYTERRAFVNQLSSPETRSG